jgi:cell division protein FtsN
MEEKQATEKKEAAKTYKVTCGTYEKRDDALLAAAKTKQAGIDVKLTIKNGKYTLLYAEGLTATEAKKAKAEAEKKKIKANIQ